MTLSPKNANSLLRLPTCACGLALFFAAASAPAQTPALVPLPFVTAVAGVPAGSTNAQCSASADIPNNVGTDLGDGCLPTQANLVGIYGAFTDSAGNIYITENGTNNDIRVIYEGGSVLTQLLIASSPAITDFAPVPGHIYTLAGARASTLAKVSGKYTCNGVATGPVALDSAGDGCPGTQAYIKPRGMSVDANGNVFFVSTGGGNVVKVLYAGGTQVANLIATENPGVTPQVGYVYQLAGQSSPSYNGDGGLAKASALIVVRDIVVDPSGNLYISDGTSSATSGNTVRRIDGVTGIITTYAGGGGNCAQPSASCPENESGDGGPATQALLDGPYNLFLDRFNNLYISEYAGDRIRVVYAGGTIAGIASPVVGDIYTYAGGGTSSTNGTLANQAKFGSVQVTGIDQAGNIYLEDGTTKNIWRFDANTGVGYIIAGRPSGSAPTAGNFCNGTNGPTSLDNFGDGCPATEAALSDIGRISFDPQGNFYTGENGNGIVRRYSYNTQFPATNVASTATQPLAFEALSPVTLAAESFTMQGQATTDYIDAGTGTCAATSALAAAQVCVFNVNFTPTHDAERPGALQLSGATGVLTTSLLSGVGVAADLAIDPPTHTSAGTGLAPSGVVTDVFGNIYIADRTGNQVLKGSATGSTLTPLVTGLNKPSGLALDSLGNLYIADTGNNRVLETTSAGTTIATIGNSLNAPQGVAVDAYGNAFIADTGNNRVVEVTPNGVQTVAPLTGLAVPTQLSFDSTGNLFVVDSGNGRVVELPVDGNQTTVALPGVTPTAVAVGPSGTIYVTDSTSLQLLAFAPGATTGTTLLTGLIKPAAIAVDADGNIYIADSGATSATYLERSLANVTFPITNVNQTSTASINLTNVGNAPLDFPTANLSSLTGSQEFTLAPSTTNGCATGTAYAPGAECNFTASFAPTVRGVVTASATFNTNAANAASASLTGNGQQLVTTGSTIAVQSPAGAIVYGQPVVIAASVTPSSNIGAPTGTVVFTVDGRAQAPLAYGTGTYSLTLNPVVGTHAVSIAFSGDGLYASSAADTSFTVGLAATTTTLAVAPQNGNGAISLVFTATVNSATASGETGTIAFYAGTQLLSTQPLSTTTRTASYTTSTLSFPSNSFTAVYSGDANFAGSTSAAVVGAGDFAIGSNTPSISIPQGGVAAVNFVIDALYGGTGTVTPACSGLPANSVCRFEPTTIALNGNTAVQMEIYTNVNSNLASNSEPRSFGGNEIFLAALFPLGLLVFGRRSRRLRIASLLCCGLFLATLPLTGCGSGSTAATGNEGLVTPVGTSTITVTFAGAAPLATHTTGFTFTVVANPSGM
ncbi:MAG TPA: Ig-like domain repeat protein [Acidobacteriaceae bacterium]|nr:Ig-like domain repeat protein [Acidobacteriaceae bacterium]